MAAPKHTIVLLQETGICIIRVHAHFAVFWPPVFCSEDWVLPWAVGGFCHSMQPYTLEVPRSMKIATLTYHRAIWTDTDKSCIAACLLFFLSFLSILMFLGWRMVHFLRWLTASKSTRTFSDFESVGDAMNCICQLYEQRLKQMNPGMSSQPTRSIPKYAMHSSAKYALPLKPSPTNAQTCVRTFLVTSRR